MKDAVIGIDIGGTFTKYGIVDGEGKCLVENFIKTDTHQEFDLYLKELVDAVEEAKKSLKGEVAIKGVGIGAPNGNYYAGTIENAVNLNWKGVVPVVDKMKKYFPDIPIVLTNDVNAAAIGEMEFGGAKGMRDFIVIALGTGLGSGIVVNGQLVYGHDGFAGELGHTKVVHNGRDCGCGGKGCLEAYASATGLKRTVYELLADRMIDSELRDVKFNDLTAKMISEAAQRGDAIALEAFERTGKTLGRALADTVAHTSPEAIFLSGGVANSRELITVPTKKYMEENLLPIFRNKVKILISQLPDMNVGLVGAAALAWNELKK
ncbi:MAG: ROK family protein [Bacteroidales bacterium]|nr:ROK family protein [Bacteroidales bacterium]